MKNNYQSWKTTLFSLFIFLFLLGCGDKDGEAAQETIAPCDFLTEALVKSTYSLDEDFEIETQPTYGSNPICSYQWEIPGPGGDFIGSELFQVSLNFSTRGKTSNDQAEKDWESQNVGVYSTYDMDEVNGVGEKATWTTLGLGQLRVLYKGYIFYVNTNYRVMEEKEETPFPQHVVKDHEVMKERAITLAQAIIAKL